MARPKGNFIDGRLLRERRKMAELTQDRLAERCGLTRSVIQKAERGGPLAAATVSTLCGHLGCSREALVVPEDWKRNAAAQVISPIQPEEAVKVGSIWKQTREMLYRMPPRLLQALALRNLARVLPVYSPRCREAEVHFRDVVRAVGVARREIHGLLGQGGAAGKRELAKMADACYLAAGFARGGRYEDDAHAADAAFAVGIAAARILESVGIEAERDSGKTDADHWRVVEFATSACHAAVHASVYLAMDEALLRAATLDTHDLRNAAEPSKVLAAPLWEGGQLPGALKLFMSRFLREAHFPHDIRVLWNRWVRRGFEGTPDG